MSNPTPPGDTTPPLATSVAATPSNGEANSPNEHRASHRRPQRFREASHVRHLAKGLIRGDVREQGAGCEDPTGNPHLTVLFDSPPKRCLLDQLQLRYMRHDHCLASMWSGRPPHEPVTVCYPHSEKIQHLQADMLMSSASGTASKGDTRRRGGKSLTWRI
jgi:hypothetical protein